MAAPYTHRNLEDVEDSAPKFGYEEVQEARFANEALETEQAGFALERVKPGKRQGFGHRHESAEEIYVVIAGSGRVKLDDEIVELKRLDAIRVSPEVARQFEADDDGLEILAFGARHEGDGELLHGWWDENG
jgi:mannose-6-phosphate isomerase-like protein (cupin superfamily)